MHFKVLQLIVATFLWAGVAVASAGDALEASLEATCRIVNGETSGTCFFIACDEGSSESKITAASTASDDGDSTEQKSAIKVVLITAAHFFEQAKQGECQLVLRTRSANGAIMRREVSLKFREGERALWKKHPELDVAVLPVILPKGVANAPLSLRHLCVKSHLADRTVRVGQEVFVPGFPAKLEGNAAGYAVVRRGTIASYPLSPSALDKTILVGVNTFGGDSGAPVVVASGQEPLIIGLVVGMQRQTDKATLTFEEVTVHTPLGLAIIVPAPSIKETIDLLEN